MHVVLYVYHMYLALRIGSTNIHLILLPAMKRNRKPIFRQKKNFVSINLKNRLLKKFEYSLYFACTYFLYSTYTHTHTL